MEGLGSLSFFPCPLCSVSPFVILHPPPSRLSLETCYSDLCCLSFPLFPSLSFERSLRKISTFCLPNCLQRCLPDMCSNVANLPSVSTSVYRDFLLISTLGRFSAVCLPIRLQRPVAQISALALLLSSLLSLLRHPFVGSLLSVSPSVFRDLLLRSLFLLSSSLPLSFFREIPM